MRISRVREKLNNRQPVIVTKINSLDPVFADMVGLIGYDCLWLCQEHTPIDGDRLGHLIRTCNMNNMDTMVRVGKGSYSDFIRPLELGATGIMVPHCMSAAEARAIVQSTRFQPVGRRPIDSGNSDGAYCMIPLAGYIKHTSEQTFIVVQIEDPEAVAEAEEIASIPGIDVIFIGPGDLSHAMGRPGDASHPDVAAAIDSVIAACNRYGRPWGIPVSPETAPKYIEKGALFLTSGADVLGLSAYWMAQRAKFEAMGVKFQPKV